MPKPDKNIISKESATEQLELMYDYYDMDLSENETMEKTEARLVKAIRRGRLEIKLDDDSTLSVVQILKKPIGDVEKISYREISGRHKAIMDREKEDQGYKRMYALLGSLSGEGGKAFEKLHAVDVSVAECLSLVFLAV